MLSFESKDIRTVLSPRMTMREPDEISDSPSRTSESYALLRHRKSNDYRVLNLSHHICTAFVLLLIITTLLLFTAFYYVKSRNCTDDWRLYNRSAHLLFEDTEKLNTLSRQLSSEFDTENIRENLEFLAKKAHIAGSRESAYIMQFLADKYTSLGFSVKVHNYTVLLNYPQISVPNTVNFLDNDGSWTILSGGRGTPKGPEEAIAEQQDIRSQQWWNAYSANGTVDGQIVYCNYGTKDDYETLSQLGVDVRGRIGLIRYGGIKRFEKVKLAQLKGLTAVLLFSDPIHYTSTNKSNVFPDSLYLPGDEVQRGSVLATHGDPLTPLLPSLIYTHRQETEQTARDQGVLPKIIVTPIGYNNAKNILNMLDGDPSPNYLWRGGLQSEYRVTGEQLFRVTVHSRFVHRTISNVIATMKGSDEPDKWVLVGNHVDAWGNGAIDPISGTATQLEMARVASKVFASSPPKRSIVFCHWDAEEYGLIGSTEWVEEMQHILHRRAVAYINVDHIAGNTTPDVKAVPLLYRAIAAAAKKTKQPNAMERSMGRMRLFDSWRYHRGKGSITGDKDIPEIGFPSAGSDYQRFISFLGIPAADIKMENAPGASYPLYHTMYETPWMVKNLMDESFVSFTTVGQFWMELTHRLANSMIIPFDVVDYANIISGMIQKTEATMVHLNITTKMPQISNQIFLLKEAMERLHDASRDFQNQIQQKKSKGITRTEIESANSRLVEIERSFVDWTRGNKLDRHILFSPSTSSSQFMSEIQDSARDVAIHWRNEDMKRLALSFSKLQLAVESTINVLTL